jgi:hypothetical protein
VTAAADFTMKEAVAAFADLVGRRALRGELRSAPSTTIDELGALLPISGELVELWSTANPVNLDIPISNYMEMRFLGASDLLAGQAGYRLDFHGNALDDWPPEWLVIAQTEDDPIIVSASPGAAVAPVLISSHDVEVWKAAELAPTLATFLLAFSKYIDVLWSEESSGLLSRTQRAELVRVLEPLVGVTRLPRWMFRLFVSSIDNFGFELPPDAIATVGRPDEFERFVEATRAAQLSSAPRRKR